MKPSVVARWRRRPRASCFPKRPRTDPRAVPRSAVEPPFGTARAARQSNDAAERVAAVQIADARARSTRSSDAIGTRSQHPAAERIVQRDIISEHDRAAGARRRQSAQRAALRRRCRDGRRRPAEETETGHHPLIVETQRRRRCNGRGVHRRRARVDRRPRRVRFAGHGDAFGEAFRAKLDAMGPAGSVTARSAGANRRVGAIVTCPPGQARSARTPSGCVFVVSRASP